MTKTLETKKKILDLLTKKKMTVTEMSEELHLAKATVSQHISELEKMGAITQENNDYYKKIKYFKLSNSGAAQEVGMRKGLIGGALVVIIIGLALIAVLIARPSGIYPISSSITSSNISTLNISVLTSATTSIPINYACPMLFIYKNPNSTILYNIVNDIANGYSCQLTYINPNTSSFTGGLGGLNYTSFNGTLSVPAINFTFTISQSQIANLKNKTNSGYCYETSALKFFGINYIGTNGVRCKANIYN